MRRRKEEESARLNNQRHTYNPSGGHPAQRDSMDLMRRSDVNPSPLPDLRMAISPIDPRESLNASQNVEPARPFWHGVPSTRVSQDRVRPLVEEHPEGEQLREGAFSPIRRRDRDPQVVYYNSPFSDKKAN